MLVLWAEPEQRPSAKIRSRNFAKNGSLENFRLYGVNFF